mgnify:FL=1
MLHLVYISAELSGGKVDENQVTEKHTDGRGHFTDFTREVCTNELSGHVQGRTGKGFAADKNSVAMTAVHALQHYGINTINLHQMKQEIQVYT